MTELPIDENTPRILIVEDEPKLGQLLIDYLRAASYAPTLISHGDQVLPYVRQTPPDLILLDLMLPGTDGLTLCREIRRFSDIPIVMVTAKIEEIDRGRKAQATTGDRPGRLLPAADLAGCFCQRERLHIIVVCRVSTAQRCRSPAHCGISVATAYAVRENIGHKICRICRFFRGSWPICAACSSLAGGALRGIACRQFVPSSRFIRVLPRGSAARTPARVISFAAKAVYRN